MVLDGGDADEFVGLFEGREKDGPVPDELCAFEGCRAKETVFGHNDFRAGGGGGFGDTAYCETACRVVDGIVGDDDLFRAAAVVAEPDDGSDKFGVCGCAEHGRRGEGYVWFDRDGFAGFYESFYSA